MSKVFVIHEPRGPRDFTSADRYGPIYNLLNQSDKPSLAPGPCLHKLRRELGQIGPDDYLTFAGGDPLAPLLAGIALADSGLRDLNWLRWERTMGADGQRIQQAGFYVPVQLCIREPRR